MDNVITEIRRKLYNAGREQEILEANTINLIASDNLTPAWRQHCRPYNGNMIQEGIVGERPFAGAEIHDELETLAAKTAKHIFGTDHAILQSHSCSQANQAVFHALLKPGDKVISLQFKAGGHLTHGMKANFSGKLYQFYYYGLNDSLKIDYSDLAILAEEVKPSLIVCGSSSYPWHYDIPLLRKIADSVSAKLMLDVSHEAGLIAGKAFKCELSVADVVTMSLDKTMRGAHGAAILCKESLAKKINRAVHPGTQSSFPIRRLTDATVALIETQTEIFREYAHRAISLSQSIAHYFNKLMPGSVPGGGTEKHYLLLETKLSLGLSGAEAENILEKVGILSNRQSLPNDASNDFKEAGGIRIGTAWISSGGYEISDAERVAEIILNTLSKKWSIAQSRAAVKEVISSCRIKDVRKIYNLVEFSGEN